MIPYIMTDQSITLMLGSKPVVVPSSHAHFEAIRDSLRDGVDDVEFYRDLVDIKEAVVRYMKGYVRVEDGVLTYKDRPIRSEEQTSELQSLMRISYAVFC